MYLMSSYQNYSLASHTYDKTRAPVGIEVIRQVLADGPVSLQHQAVVDAGCGTGLYTAALAPAVGQIEAVDINPGMLAQARSKIASAGYRRRVLFHQAPIDTLPLRDESADAVMVNQVLHHLPDNAAAGWPNHARVLREFARVLKPGGTVIINSCGQEQLERGFWFYHLIPEAVQRMKEKVINLEALDDLLWQSGFVRVHRQVPYSTVLQGEAYFHAEGILDPAWRSGDSIWSLVSENDLRPILERISNLKATGDLGAFVQQADCSRSRVGQITFTIARKATD